MIFVKAEELKTGMRLAKPVYNKTGVMLYERDSKLTPQGIVSIQNFGLIGVYVLEPAEPVPPMSEDDVEFERFQAMAVFSIKEILDDVSKQKEPEQLYQFANQIVKNYGALDHKINFIQNLRSVEDYVYKHSLNTALLCAMMAKQMNVEFKKQLDLVVAAILHDIGTLLIPVLLRRKTELERTEEDLKKINTYYVAAYQMFSRDYALEAGVKLILAVAMRRIFQVGGKSDELEKRHVREVEILRTAYMFDQLTAMNIQEEPASDVMALRFLLDPNNGYDQETVQALINSINILEPGVCVELTTGDRGLVIAPGVTNVLEPYILSFRDNQIYNMGDPSVSEKMQIKDIMKTMDNRHVMGKDMLDEYSGDVLHMGEHLDKKNY
ncbi:MAG: HD domain-containing protein [Lachnospiraceae bacterium]|nr:HD domain-containing protein [Lachnospiraceae bacterium]